MITFIVRLCALLLAAACLLLQTTARAQVGTATLNASGNWNTAGSWLSTPAGFAPNNGNNGQNWNATINSNTVTVDAATIIQSLTFGGGTIQGAQSLTVNAASTVTGGVFLGSGSTTFASGSTLTLGAGFLINARTVNNAGTASYSSGSNLSFTIENSGSLTNQTGGTMTFNQTANTLSVDSQVGFPGSLNNAGMFNKDGAGTMAVGASGTVTFNNTGTVNVNSGTLSLQSGVTQHSGSTLTAGTWNVSGGGTLTFTTGSNLTTIGSAASVMLDGATSTFNRIPVTASTLTTNQGGFTLKNDRDITTASAFTNSGTVSIQDSTTLFRIGASGGSAYTQTGGFTILAGGAMIDASAFNLNGGTLSGTGTIDAPLTNSGTTTIAPGASAGTLTINGSTVLGSGNTLAMEVGGLAAGIDYDVLDVNGALTLAGLLDIDFLNLFENTVLPSDIFTIATADSAILGSFSNVASGSRIGTNTIKTFEVWYGTGSPYGASNLVLTQAPEPSRALLLMLGLVGAMMRRRER